MESKILLFFFNDVLVERFTLQVFSRFMGDFVHTRHHTRHDFTKKNLKSLWNLVSSEIFGSLGVTFAEKLAFKNIKISVWQKRKWAHTFFVQFWAFKPASHKKHSIHRAQIPWDS